MSAVPADDVSWNVVKPLLFMMTAALAVVPLKKCASPPNRLVIDVIPVVLELTTLTMPSLVTPPTILPAAVNVPSCSVVQAQMNVSPI